MIWGNVSNGLTIPTFVIDTTKPVLTQVTEIVTPSNILHPPMYLVQLKQEPCHILVPLILTPKCCCRREFNYFNTW